MKGLLVRQVSDKMFVIYFSLILVCISFEVSATIVETESGPVRGYLRDADLGKKYISFRGVPYSKQPVDDLKFMALEPPDAWEEVYNASNQVPMCPQRLKFVSPKYLQQEHMSEACLGANIYVPAEMDGPLPVLVYLHGSVFNVFSSSQEIYGPEYLVAKDIIVVTVNIRQNVWGYLSLETNYAPGNNGVKDAFYFLKWIQRNIAAFGGDPSKVTLGGQSAGAIITHLFSLYPPAEGLFRSMIMQSGNALVSALSYSPAYVTDLNTQLLSLLGINSTDAQEVFEIIKSVDEKTLREVTDTLIDQFVLVLFSPTKEVESENAILTSYPTDLMSAMKFIDVPQLIGYTTDECLTVYYRLKDIDLVDGIRSTPSSILPRDLEYSVPIDEQTPIVQKLFEEYIELNDTDDQLLSQYMNLCSDSTYIYPTLRYAKFSAFKKQSPTYLYQFSFNGKNNLLTRVVSESPKTGAGHLDDVNYLFKAHFYEEFLSETLAENSIEELTKNRMVEMWANFVKTGNPTPELTEEIPIEWPPTDADSLTYLDINTELSVKTNPHPDMIKFYEQFYDNLIGV